jgi:hypothetical protein
VYGENQQDQIVSTQKPVPQMPVGFPAKPPGPVPFYCIPETPGKGKTYPVMGQTVFQNKKFRTSAACGTAGKTSATAKNFPNLVPSL